MRAMQIVDFGYIQRDVTLIFFIVDLDHNLIILFLISLRIWNIDVHVKLTQQDVENLRLHVGFLLGICGLSFIGSRSRIATLISLGIRRDL